MLKALCCRLGFLGNTSRFRWSRRFSLSICVFGINTNGKERKGRQQVGSGGIEKLSSGAKDKAFMLTSSLALDGHDLG